MVARPGHSAPEARASARAIGLCFAALALLAPQIALACPYCAGRQRGGNGTNLILTAFVSLPFLLSWAIYRIVKAEQSAAMAASETSAFKRSRRKAQ
jgi:hypothetical protein